MHYLFSVDLEDIRLMVPGGNQYQPRVVEMTHRYLSFLRQRSFHGTFFVVGDVARAHPDLIREIVSDGHEIGCHTDTHIPLESHTPASFRDDLLRNLEALYAAGAEQIRGFRAPVFSLVSETRWAYEVLAELGFTYSSSVLPGKHPLYGWAEFGRQPRCVGGVLELPITLSPFPFPRWPFGGGVYFRVLPRRVLSGIFRWHFRRKLPVLGYLHPFDIDSEQERFAHPLVGDRLLYNTLMYLN